MEIGLEQFPDTGLYVFTQTLPLSEVVRMERVSKGIQKLARKILMEFQSLDFADDQKLARITVDDLQTLLDSKLNSARLTSLNAGRLIEDSSKFALVLNRCANIFDFTAIDNSATHSQVESAFNCYRNCLRSLKTNPSNISQWNWASMPQTLRNLDMQNFQADLATVFRLIAENLPILVEVRILQETVIVDYKPILKDLNQAFNTFCGKMICLEVLDIRLFLEPVRSCKPLLFKTPPTGFPSKLRRFCFNTFPTEHTIITEEILAKLACDCPSLEALNLRQDSSPKHTHSENLGCLLALRNLKNIDISGIPGDPSPFLNQLAVRGTLVTLAADRTLINNQVLEKIGSFCLKLREIHLNQCEEISQWAVESLIEQMSKRHGIRLLISVEATTIGISRKMKKRLEIAKKNLADFDLIGFKENQQTTETDKSSRKPAFVRKKGFGDSTLWTTDQFNKN